VLGIDPEKKTLVVRDLTDHLNLPTIRRSDPATARPLSCRRSPVSTPHVFTLRNPLSARAIRDYTRHAAAQRGDHRSASSAWRWSRTWPWPP
jgi:hypothetical protein